MVNRTLENNSLPKLIAEKITEQILMGELQPGERIAETTYAEEYGISRAPIREALYLLTIEGLVERIPRKGAIVKGYTELELFDLMEIRKMIEDLAITRIKGHGSDPSIIEEMESLIPLMEDTTSREQYALLNHQFHSLLINMTKSEVIMNMYSRLGLPLLTLQTMSFMEEHDISKSLHDHCLIIEMLKEGDLEKARNTLEKHNNDVIKRVEKTFAMNKSGE
jgi:DNA-binding GntR family transcriptional regulator